MQLENDLAQRKGVHCKIYSGNEGKNIEAYRNPPGVMSAEAYGLSREVVFINTIILPKLDYLDSSFYKVIYNHDFEVSSETI